MILRDVMKTLNAQVHCGEDLLDTVITSACGADLMSDVLAFVKEQSVLLTGLVNPQTVRTAEMMDMRCVVFVRGKTPDQATLDLARKKGIVIMSTAYPMYQACGRLYAGGLN